MNGAVDLIVPCPVKYFASKSPLLKANKTHGFNSCIVISVYPLNILSIKKGTEYLNN